jgi:hypothetical protein
MGIDAVSTRGSLTKRGILSRIRRKRAMSQDSLSQGFVYLFERKDRNQDA